jgi:formylmethanofuran dehydrogenase subunit E
VFEENREIVNSIENLGEAEREILYSAVNIHGHACGGMPMGFVAGMAALKALGIERERNMDTLAIVEVGNGHAAGCFVDGVQFATGCTFGKGVLKKEPKGKWNFRLIDRRTARAVKVTLRPEVLAKAFAAPFITEYRIKGVNPTDIPAELGRAGFTRPFGLPADDVVKIEGPFDIDLPRPTPCFTTVLCATCGDTVAENYARLEDGQAVCPDCCHYAK